MINSKDVYSILSIQDNLFLSKDGSVGACFMLSNPEPYSLDHKKLDLRHSAFVHSFKNFEDAIYIHKQDIVIEEKYNKLTHYDTNTFLSKADADHFDGRKTIVHYSLLTFTIGGLNSLEKLSNFFEKVKSSVSLLNHLFNTSVDPIDSGELTYLLVNYVNGFQKDQGLRDVVFDNKINIGDHNYSVFSISDSNYLPDTISNVSEDKSIQRENLELSRGFMDDLGVYLPFNHIYNQLFFFPGHNRLKSEFEDRLKQYEMNQSFSGSIKREFERLKAVEDQILEGDSILCKAHFNIITWDKNSNNLEAKEDKIKAILESKSIHYYVPTFEGLTNIFLGTIIGRATRLHQDYLFLNTLEVSLCMLTNYSFYKDDDAGIIVQDRILQVPFRIDLWDAHKKRINARNFITFAPTGSGKSSDTLNQAQQFIEEGYNLVIAEFGNSFEQLAKLYPKESKHIKINSSTPLGINSFDLNGAQLSSEKLYSLTAVVMKFWRLPIAQKRDANLVVAISKTIQDYYNHVTCSHHFISYYNYIKSHFSAICTRMEIPEKYFDIESFLMVCSEFLEGGMYHNIVAINDTVESSLIHKSALIFELKEIKDNPFLVSIIMTILMDAVNEKILSDKRKKAYFIFDEMALGSELVDAYTGEDMLSTISLMVATIRKDNGAVGLIYQTPNQIPKNNSYAESIIDNTQILNVLEGNESVYDAIISRFSIKNEEHISMMKSIKNDFDTDRPYSEKFIRFNEQYAVIVKNEFSKEKYYAFQTEGEDWKALNNLYKESNDMEKAIKQYIKLKDEAFN